jgi:predicted nucleic-acid-binding protein
MKITADTNVLVRALVQDDPEQAELVAIPIPVLCELVWVLRRVYRCSSHDCVSAIEALLASSSVVAISPMA